MQEFIAFLRLTTIGTLALVLTGVIFVKSIFTIILGYGDSGPVIFLILSTLVGLMLEPLLRRHPLRNEVKQVYDQVRCIILSEAIKVYSQTQRTENNLFPSIFSENTSTAKVLGVEFYEALSKSAYDFLIFTFPGSEHYMRRVNQQIRYAYFYFFLWYLYKGAAYSAFLALFFKILINESHNPITIFLAAFIDIDLINSQFLMGGMNFSKLAKILLTIVPLSYIPASYFYRVAEETMLVELYSRHIVIAQNKKKLEEIARDVLMNLNLIQTFAARAANVKDMKKRGKGLEYWFTPGNNTPYQIAGAIYAKIFKRRKE